MVNQSNVKALLDFSEKREIVLPDAAPVMRITAPSNSEDRSASAPVELFTVVEAMPEDFALTAEVWYF